MRRTDLKWLIVVAIVAYAALVAVRRGGQQQPDAVPVQSGYVPNPEGVRRFLDELPQPYFAQAGAECIKNAKYKDVFLYRHMLRAHEAKYGKPFVVGRQQRGSCVAWGAMHAVYCGECVSWAIGERPDPPLMPATAPIYGGSRVESRRSDPRGFDGSSPVGGFSDGSFGAAAARWLKNWGVVYAQNYPGIFDYTVAGFSGDREGEEGAYGAGGKNDNYRLDTIAKQTPCRHVAKVSTWEELCSALESGFCVTIASGQGFSSHANEYSIAEASGAWAHQMVAFSVMHKKNGQAPCDMVAILNSWGPSWLKYERKFPPDLPSGAFWARREVVERMIRSDSWAIGDTAFRYRDVDHMNVLGTEP
jgi:hypothetical protein